METAIKCLLAEEEKLRSRMAECDRETEYYSDQLKELSEMRRGLVVKLQDLNNALMALGHKRA